MRKKGLIAIFVIALAFGGFLGFIITGFATSGSTRDSFNFYYEPSSPSPIEELLVNVDVGGVEIQYNTSNTRYYAQVEVSIAVSGLFMAGKSYLDFFSPYTTWWDNISTPTSFNMEVKPDVWFDPSHWFKSYNIDIIITLRTDVVYDIMANVATGSLKMNVPESVILYNTFLQTTTGEALLKTTNVLFMGEAYIMSTTGKTSIISTGTNYTHGLISGTSTGALTLDLANCAIGDDLYGAVTTGSIIYNADNLTFAQDSSIDLSSVTGGINGTIHQYVDLGANVTSKFGVTTGGIDLIYINDKPSIGTKFNSTYITGNLNYVYPPLEFTEINGILTSGNYFSAPFRYTFRLSTVTGNINVNAESHHL